jgi:hypothetical protein
LRPKTAAKQETTLNPVLVLRTDRMNERIEAELQRLSASGMPILVAADERKAPVDTGRFAKASLSEQSMNRLGLLAHPNAGWLCGDYVLYLAREARPDADEFWLIEPDVRINFDRPGEFFDSFAGVEADLLCVRHDVAPASWYWHDRMAPHRSPVYRMLFGMLRISRRAVAHLLPARQKMNNVPHADYPNDESFVASVLGNDGFTIRTFGETRDVVTNRTFSFARPFSGTVMDRSRRDDLVYHAVLYGEDYLRKAQYFCRAHPGEASINFATEGVRVELGDARATQFREEAMRLLTARGPA